MTVSVWTAWPVHVCVCVYLAVLDVISQGVNHRSRSSFSTKEVELIQSLQCSLAVKQQSLDCHRQNNTAVIPVWYNETEVSGFAWLVHRVAFYLCTLARVKTEIESYFTYDRIGFSKGKRKTDKQEAYSPVTRLMILAVTILFFGQHFVLNPESSLSHKTLKIYFW